MVVRTPESPLNPAPMEQQVSQFCGDCHAVPPAGSFPKRAWRDHVGLGYQLYLESHRNDMVIPPFDRMVDYYESRGTAGTCFAGT